MDKAEADAELTRLQRAERASYRNQETLRYKITATENRVEALNALIAGVDAAIHRRRETRGDAFTMTVDGVRHGKRHDAGHSLRHLLQQQTAMLSDHGRMPVHARHGHLAGFDVTSTVQRVLGATQFTIALDGVPEAEIRLTPDELGDIDPAKLVVRLENRLSNLETVKAKTISEIDRLRTEAARARDDLARPFPQARQLAEARDRVQQIDHQLQEAARAPQGEHHQDASAGANSDAGHAETRVREGNRAYIERAGSQAEAVQITQRDFPRANHATGPAALAAASRPASPSRRDLHPRPAQ